LTRQSIYLRLNLATQMDARVKPAHDEGKAGGLHFPKKKPSPKGGLSQVTGAKNETA
jgi:hypothetical protein